MTFFLPIPLNRKNQIIKKLTKSGAISFETSKTFLEVGILNPKKFKNITDKLLMDGVISKTLDNKYYINKK